MKSRSKPMRIGIIRKNILAVSYQRLLFILSSIIVINGVFLCYSSTEIAPRSMVMTVQDSEVNQLRHSFQMILKNPRFQYHDNLNWLKWILKKTSGLFKIGPRIIPQKLQLNEKTWRILLQVLGISVLVLLPFIAAFLAAHFLQHDQHLKTGINLKNPSTINSTALKRTALTMAKTGRYRDGVRYLYLAGLEKLKEEKLLLQAAKFSDKENLKNLRMIIGENHPGYLAFKELTGIFQEKWYGFKDCQAPDYHLAENKLALLDGLGK